MRIFIRLVTLLVLFQPVLVAQKVNITIVKGTVTDAATKLPISFATVSVPGLPLGQQTDENGHYAIKTDKPITMIKASALGYRTQEILVRTGKTQEIDITLLDESRQLGEIVIKPEKYRNKNNPAVELIKRVIDNRDKNHIEEMSAYHDEQYEKLFFGLTNLKNEMKNRKMLKGIRFLLDNTDTSKVEGMAVIPVFLQENIMDYYSQSDPKKWKKLVKASKSVRFPGFIDHDGFNKSLQYLYEEIDIYDNYITLLTDKFLSPIANNAPLFYRYYPQDTTVENGRKVVRLEFYPRNKFDMLLQGELYIALDSTYPVTRINFTINPNINLNWVNDLDITQNYTFLPNGKCIIVSEDYRIQFGITEKSLGMAAQRYVLHQNPEFNQSSPEGTLQGVSEIVFLPGSTQNDTTYWATKRPTPLTQAENYTYTHMDSLQRTSFFKVVSKSLYILVGAYAPAGRWLEIGPINSFYAFNDVEGTRFRFGGRTSTNFSDRYRLEGYAAYGLKDQQWKYRLKGTFALPGSTFNKFPYNLLRVSYVNDVIIPGQNFQGVGSNLGNSFVRGINDKFFLNKKLNLEYEREFENHFSFQTGLVQQDFKPLGALSFIPAEGGAPVYKPVSASGAYLQLRYAPGEKNYQGTNGRVLVDFNYVANIRYSKGIKGFMNGQYNYNELTASIYKYTDLPPFGYNFLYMEAGAIFGKVPYPLLTVHRGNQSYINLPFSYNLMNFMEFISDRYFTVMTEHYFNGLIFNKIPLFRRLKFREVCAFKMIYGRVTDINQPKEGSGLYLFPMQPDGSPLSYSLSARPYLEASVGISNILKVLRVDLIRRFNYLNHPNVSQFGIRASAVVTF